MGREVNVCRWKAAQSFTARFGHDPADRAKPSQTEQVERFMEAEKLANGQHSLIVTTNPAVCQCGGQAKEPDLVPKRSSSDLETGESSMDLR